MTQTAYDSLRTGAATLVRGDAGALLLGDADRVDFLQRMTTNDIAALQAGQSAVTILTSPTARVLFVFTVLRREDDLLLLPAPGESARLERHLRGQIFFMDKVSVRNAGDAWARLRVVGPQAAQAVSALGLPLPAAADAWSEHAGTIVLRQERYDLPGYELLVERGCLAESLATLAAAGAAVVADDAALAARRVELGRPAVGAELTDDVSPLEAGMAWACAENKGCYTGQEILARQITYDKVTRTLVGLRGDSPLAAGAMLQSEGRDVGRITSAAISPVEGAIALAIVKRPWNAPGQALQAGGVGATVVELPMDSRTS